MVLDVRDGRLDIELIKARGGALGALAIDPSAFDAVQGAEWPVPAAPAASEPSEAPRVPPASVTPLHAGTRRPSRIAAH